MMVSDLIQLFLDSRRRGVTGARKKSSAATMRIYAYTLKVFAKYLETETEEGGVLNYKGVRRLHIVQFIDWLDKKVEKKEWSKASVIQVLQSMRTFFRWIDADEECQLYELKGMQKYLPAIEKKPRRLDIPAIKDLKTFKTSFNTADNWEYRDYVATCLMLDTGMRLGEVCNLQVDHVMFEEKMVFVTGKTGLRAISVTVDMLQIIKGWLKRRVKCPQSAESPYLFVSKRAPQMTPNAFGNSFRKHRKKFGLPRISAHTLRHSFCTHYIRKGGDMEKLRTMTGHTTYEMLKDYLHIAKAGSKPQQEELEKVSLLKDM